MPWTETDPLDVPAVSSATVENSTMLILLTWIRQFFTGETHTIDGRPIAIPKVATQMQDGLMLIPSGATDDVSITVVCTSRDGGKRRHSNGDVWRMHSKATLTFAVRAKGQNVGEDARVKVRKVADILYDLFQRRCVTVPMSRLGIKHVKSSPPMVRTLPGVHQRDLIVTAGLIFPVSS